MGQFLALFWRSASQAFPFALNEHKCGEIRKAAYGRGQRFALVGCFQSSEPLQAFLPLPRCLENQLLVWGALLVFYM